MNGFINVINCLENYLTYYHYVLYSKYNIIGLLMNRDMDIYVDYIQ